MDSETTRKQIERIDEKTDSFMVNDHYTSEITKNLVTIKLTLVQALEIQERMGRGSKDALGEKLVGLGIKPMVKVALQPAPDGEGER
jgi:hypothetical protein